MSDSPSLDASDTSKSLLIRIKDPQNQADWDRFLAVYKPVVRGWCRGARLQESDADDVTQQVFVCVLLAVRRGFEYQPEKGRFRGWLFTVTKNEIHQFVKRRRRHIRGAGGDQFEAVLAWIESPEYTCMTSDLFISGIVESALHAVRPEFNDAVWQAFWRAWKEEADPAQVARELGRKVGWVYKAKHQVTKRLAAEIRFLTDDIVPV